MHEAPYPLEKGLSSGATHPQRWSEQQAKAVMDEIAPHVDGNTRSRRNCPRTKQAFRHSVVVQVDSLTCAFTPQREPLPGGESGTSLHVLALRRVVSAGQGFPDAGCSQPNTVCLFR